MVAVPENRAKAAAFDRWMAQGGRPGRKSGKFLTGPQKGMTYDQAKQQFEGMWAGASPEVRAKYDARVKASDAMPPGSPVAPKPPGQTYADQKKSRMGYYSRINGVTPAPPASAKKTVNPAATSGAGRGKEIGTPEERAKVSQMVNEGGDFATADSGGQAMKAAIAMSNGRPMSDAFDMTNYTGKPIGTVIGPVEKPGFSGSMVMPGASMDFARDIFRDEESKGQKTPLVSAAKAAAIGAGKLISDAAATFSESSQPSPLQVTEHRTPMGTTWKDAAGNVYPSNPNNYPSNINPAPSPSQSFSTTGLSGNTIVGETSGVARPAPAPAPVAATPAPAPAPSAPVQPMGPPATAKTPVTPAAPYGQPVIGGGAPKINRLTGLPMGYRPGDSTDGMDPAMKARAEASTARMNSATPPPRAIPVVTPARPPSVEQRAAAEMRRQAAMNANPSTVNPDDPRKFFTGRVKPLDQLVKSQTPVRPVMR